jgi:hypothetical protein
VNIRIGLTAPSPAWEELLRQEGVDHGLVDAAGRDPAEVCSALVVSAPLRPDAVSAIRAYLAGGGAVLGFARHLSAITDLACRHEKVQYLAGTGDPPFRSVGLLDLELPCDVPREANHLRTQADTFGVLAGEWGGGVVVALPFDLRDVLTDTRTALRAFPFPSDRLPAERVSLVAHGEVRHLVHDALEYLHHLRGLPYAHLWYFPGEARSVFALRIDTDAGKPEQVDRLYAIARNHGLGFSWFLDVASHATWLRRFAVMEGQEFGVHCLEHRAYRGSPEDREDVDRARAAMTGAGIPPAGFAAPYGTWSPGLGLLIEAAGFPFSSEFSFAYDTLPMAPVVEHRRLGTLQVPVHPVCAGAMRRVGYPERTMIRYFERVKAGKLLRREPLFFYHHPGDEAWDCVESICGMSAESGVCRMSLGEYARWWNVRSSGMPRVVSEGERVRTDEIPLPGGTAPVLLRLSVRGGRELLVEPGRGIDLASASWVAAPEWTPHPDLRRIRDADLRRMIAGLFSAYERRR